jgi:hypothetical protein
MSDVMADIVCRIECGYLMVLGDLTTWSLTPTEVQEGHGLVGRTGRMSGSD